MPRKDKYRIYSELLQLHPSIRRGTSSSVIEAAAMRKENFEGERKMASQGILWEQVLL
jgi:hypothetical protein